MTFPKTLLKRVQSLTKKLIEKSDTIKAAIVANDMGEILAADYGTTKDNNVLNAVMNSLFVIVDASSQQLDAGKFVTVSIELEKLKLVLTQVSQEPTLLTMVATNSNTTLGETVYLAKKFDTEIKNLIGNIYTYEGEKVS